MFESPFFHPAFLVPTALALVGFIAWLIRLESRVSTNTGSIKEQKKILADHCADNDIHFNLRVAEQVDLRNEHRFRTIETQLQEINRKLDHLAGRE